VTLSGTLDKADDKDQGYTVEIRLPFKSLDKAKTVPPALGDRWRMNLYAMQDNGGVAWSPILGQGNFHKAARFGRILFAEKGWEPKKAATAPAPSTSATISAAEMKDAVGKMKKTQEATAPAPSPAKTQSAPRKAPTAGTRPTPPKPAPSSP
jgi:hypothetical protein